MNIMTKTVCVTAAALVLATTVSAQQQGGQNGRPPMPAFGDMATALGVGEDTVKSCFPKPPQKGGRPERPDAAKLTRCLQKDNAQLTEAKVKQTLADFDPHKRKQG